MNEERDHALSRIYREGAWPEPGRQIDKAILAASRRAARERHPVLWRWAPTFAVAATVVLTSAVVLKAYREQPEALAPAAPEKAAPRAKQAMLESKPAEPRSADTKGTEAKVEANAPAVTPPRGFSSTMDALEAARLERAQRDIGFKDVAPAGGAIQPASKTPPPAKAPPALKKEAEPAHPAEPLARRADTPAAPVSVFGASPVQPQADQARLRAAVKPATPSAQSTPSAAQAATAQPEAAPAQGPALSPRAATGKPAQALLQNTPEAAPRPETIQAAPSAEAAPAPQRQAPAPASIAPNAQMQNSVGSIAITAATAKAERSPQAWIEDIRKLMKEGKSEDAGAQLAEFKKRYPDYALPEDLR